MLQSVHSARQGSSLELPFGFWRREVREGDPARNRPLTYLAVPRDEVGMPCACLAQCYPPLAALFTLLEESAQVGGAPGWENCRGGKMPPVVAQMVAPEALSTFSPGLWGSDFEIVNGGFVK